MPDTSIYRFNLLFVYPALPPSDADVMSGSPLFYVGSRSNYIDGRPCTATRRSLPSPPCPPSVPGRRSRRCRPREPAASRSGSSWLGWADGRAEDDHSTQSLQDGRRRETRVLRRHRELGPDLLVRDSVVALVPGPLSVSCFCSSSLTTDTERARPYLSCRSPATHLLSEEETSIDDEAAAAERRWLSCERGYRSRMDDLST